MAVHNELYQTLGVSPGATEAEIKKAFRALAGKLHPDKNPGDAAAEARFKKITAAYDVLSDKDRRAAYDEFGPDALSAGFDAQKARAWKQAGGFRGGGAPGGGFGGGFPGFGGGVEFDLNDLLGGFGGGGRGGGRRRAAPPREAEVRLDLGQALRGVEVEVGGQRVRIPPGADDGASVKVDTAEGPLRIHIRVEPHPHFTRSGLDLTLKLPVTLGELAAGAAVDVPTPEGPVSMKIPPRTAAGARLRLRGRGVERKGHKGDLYVELVPRLPDRWDDALVEACRQADALYDRPVREGVEL